MADLIKVKPKKNYEWNQDNKFLYVRIPMPSHTSLKKIQIFLSDMILRITSLQKKTTHFLDLAQQVDYKSPQNKFILTDGEIHCTLKKQELLNWQKLLIQDISLADLKVRRRESEARYQQNVKELQQTKDKLRNDYDRKATQQLMRFQQEQRKKLQQRKNAEKNNAIKEIFSNINQNTGKIQKTENKNFKNQQKSHKIQHQEKKWQQKQKIALQLIQKQQQNERERLNKMKNQSNKQKIIQKVAKQFQVKEKITKSPVNTMFTQEDIEKCDQMRQNGGQVDYQQIPIRKAANVQVKFTERIFPHLAARDTYVKEPPMPKGKSNKNSLDGDLQTKNPLWLKDKGDKFYSDKNYISAIEAYTEALNIDGKMLNAYLNRAMCYLKTFNYNGVINDCDKAIVSMQGQLGGSEEDNSKSFNLMIKIRSRKAIALAWKGQLVQAKKQISQILSSQNISQEIKSQLNKYLHQITQREQSIRYKLKGDEYVKSGNFQKAINFYDQAISVDKNEYAISNKGLCLNKIKNYTASTQILTEGIQKINSFNISNATVSKTGTIDKSQKNTHNLLLKMYFRKAKALQELGKIKQAQQTLHKGLAIDSSDVDFQALLKEINFKKNKQIIKEQKQLAANLIKSQKYKQALDIYAKCLKMFESSQDLNQYLGILQNQCVCYLKLEDFDSIISTTIRILKIINNVQSKIVVFGDKKSPIINKEQLDKISIRSLMRRANAYVQKGQVYNAKSDLQKALQISPNDPTIQKQLQKIKRQLAI